MNSKVHHPRPFFRKMFSPIARDYLARRRRSRNITNIVLIALLSLLVAGIIMYTSSPTYVH
jgi:hypothetical protein